MKRTTTKILMLILAIAMVASCLTGCFGGDSEETINNLDGLNGEPSETAGVDPSETETTPPETEEPTTPPETDPPASETVMGTVTADKLNVRNGTSTDSAIVMQLAVDTRVEILEIKTVGDVVWGRISDGWVNMNYILLDGEEPADSTDVTNPSDGNNTSSSTGNATITAPELNIRKGAGSSYDVVGKYKKGDTVEILETKNNWGRTDKGWISLKYVKMDGQTTNNNDDKDDDTTSSELVSDGKTTVLGYGAVNIGSLNVRSGPGTKYDDIGNVSRGSRYAYYQKSGSWVRIKDGWVSTTYFYIEGTKGEGAGTGTITATELNARTGPSTDYKSNGSFKKGDKVEILFQLDTGSSTWGYTSKGWVSMKYVEMEKTTAAASTGKGTITASTLNIRKEPSTDAEKVGSYDKGDKVEILEVKGDWGRTDKGWISLKYVKMD